MEKWLRVLVLTVCAMLNACSTHRTQPEPSPINNPSYIDLQPGWRIRVVAPILKSGGYKVQLEDVRNQNGTITMKTGKDFEGYETDYYEVRAGNNLLKIRFRSGEVSKNDGSRHGTVRPLISLFDPPKDDQYIRLLFLTRSSDRDYDQAILTASSSEQLNLLTNQVQSDPIENCKTRFGSSCIWVPAGVAVRPEKKRGREWVPAL